MPFVRRLILPLAAIVAAVSFLTGARAGGVVERGLSLQSPALGRPLHYALYKPAEAPAAGARWPVLYLFHGGGPGEADWLDAGRIADAMDRAIAAGEIPPTVVVMPQAGDSWYVDNPDQGGAGLMETALTRDLVRAVDAALPTAACRQGRAVAGLSTGGYGALLYALDRRRQYGAAISLSGSISPPIGPQMKDRIRRAARLYDGAFGKPFSAARFNRANLFPKAAELGLSLGPKPAFYINAGDHDPGGIVQGAAELHLALLRAKADSTLRVVGGRHEWPLWRREIGPALKWLGPRLDPSCGTGSHAVAGVDADDVAPATTAH